MAHIFDIVIVPKSIIGNRMTFTLAFELNTAHEVFPVNEGDAYDPVQVRIWRDRVGEFHSKAHTLAGNLRLKIGGLQIGPVDVRSFKDDDGKIVRLWLDFLKLSSAADLDPRPHVPVIPTKLEHRLSTSTAPINGNNRRNRDVLAGQPGPTLDDQLTAALKDTGADAVPLLKEKDDRAIQAAFEAERSQIWEQLQRGRGQVTTIDAAVHLAPRSIKADAGSRTLIPEMATVTAGLEPIAQTATDLVLSELTYAGTPRYISTAFDLLNGTAELRKLFGTVREVEFDHPNDIGDNATIGLELDDDLKEYFQAVGLTRFTIRPKQDGKKLLLAGPRPDNGNVRYGEHFMGSCMILRNEPTMAPRTVCHTVEQDGLGLTGKNLIEYLTRLTKEQRSARPDVQGYVRARQELEASPSEQTKDPLDNFEKLKAILRSNTDLERTIRVNNQLADRPPTGLQVALARPGYNVPEEANSNGEVYEDEMTNGYAVYVRCRKDGMDDTTTWMSLTAMVDRFHWNDGTALEMEAHEQGIQIGAGVSMRDANDTSAIDTGFIFCWNGTNLAARNPMRRFEKETGTTAEAQIANRMSALKEQVEHTAAELTAAQLRSIPLFGIDHFPWLQDPAKHPRLRVLRRHAGVGQNPVRLSFGRDKAYQFLVVAQYRNGHVPITVDDLNAGEHKDLVAACATEWWSFERSKHITPPVICRPAGVKEEDLSPGESQAELVVRSGDATDDRTCSRWILPSPIPDFMTYQWYSVEDRQTMGHVMDAGVRYDWNKRYTCEVDDQDEFDSNKLICATKNSRIGTRCKVQGCKDAEGCERFCGGVKLPAEYGGELGYVPDPAVNGFMIRFFLDKDCRIPAPESDYPLTYCKFDAGDYPNLLPWSLVLTKAGAYHKGSMVKPDQAQRRLEVALPEGAQLRAQLIPTYCGDECTRFITQPLAYLEADERLKGSKDDQHYDLLRSAPRTLTLTHAVQRPLFDPQILDVRLVRSNPRTTRELASGITAEVTLHMEQLNVAYGVTVPGIAPTGEVELFAVWDDYGDGGREPLKSIDEKMQGSSETGGFTRIARVLPTDRPTAPVNISLASATALPPDAVKSISPSADPFRVHAMKLQFRAEPGAIPLRCFTDLVLKVRNSSKFHTYFQPAPKAADGTTTDAFARWSVKHLCKPEPYPVSPKNELQSADQFASCYLANNSTPLRPKVRSIVPLIVDDIAKSHQQRAVHGNRVRIYFEREGRMCSGKEERIAILVHHKENKYSKHLAEFTSRAATDIVLDSRAKKATLDLDHDLLTSANFRTEQHWKNAVLDTEYLAALLPKDDRALFSAPGITRKDTLDLASYLPLYDKKQRLWYVDVDMHLLNKAGLQPHNAFIRLGIVHYQPYSANYNTKGLDNATGYEDDLRVSEPVMVDFFSIYPSRRFLRPSMYSFHAQGTTCELDADLSSLYFRERKDEPVQLRTQFLLTVQQREKSSGDEWNTIPSFSNGPNYVLRESIAADDVEHLQFAPVPEVSAKLDLNGSALHYHPVLPWDLGTKLTGTQRVGARFRSTMRLGLQKLEGGHNGLKKNHHRVLLYEVDWHGPKETPMSSIQAHLDNTFHPGQIPHLRIRGIYIFEHLE